MIRLALSLGTLLVAPLIQDSGQAPQSPAVEPVELRLSVEPTEVRAGMFYSGATVRVTAEVPAGMAVAISCVGEEGPLELKRKGKVFGLIWMSVGDVTFENVPHLYLLATSSKLEETANPRTLRSSGVGYGALEAAAQPEDPSLFEEAIRFKESDGLFGVMEEGIGLEPAGSGLNRATAEFTLPAKAPAGHYRILLHGFGPDGGTLLAQEEVTVVQTGAAAFISDLATDHGLAYGIFAVMVAVVVGLVTGVLFGLGSKKGH